MYEQDLFSDTFTAAVPIKLFRKKKRAAMPIPVDVLKTVESMEGESDRFVPVVLAQAPEVVLSMPENSIEEKIAKAVEVLKWAMASYEISFSYSGGKDSSTVLSLAMQAARLLQQEGVPIKRFAILNSDTLQENPEVLGVIKKEIVKIQKWIDDYNLPGEIKVTQPPLSSQYMVSIIGGKSIISTPFTNKNCTPDLKSHPLTKARVELFGHNDVANGRFVANVTGVRFSESERRKANMEGRAESPVQLVMTDAKENVFLAPIAYWDTDTVMEYIGLASNQLLPFKTYSDFVDVWQIYKESTGECSVGRGDQPSKGCSARHGCWACTMVKDDKSMNAMVKDEKYSYMRPLAAFRDYLLNTLFDMNRRTWVGRSIKYGYITFKPDAYAPAELQKLLRYALTIDVEEQQKAALLGIKPRFQIISVEALFAIDAHWSLQGFTLPHAGLKIFREVYLEGQRFPVPDVVPFPKVPIPDARYIYVGDEWDDNAHNAEFTGLRNPLAEIASMDQNPCLGLRTVSRYGVQRSVLNVNTDDVFSVDAESALMILEFELDRLVDKYHGPDVVNLAPGGAVAGQGYLFYVQYGTLTLAANQVSKADEILRRTAWRERMGLAGYNYNHDAALLLSLERSPAEVERWAKEYSSIKAERILLQKKRVERAAKRAHLERCLTVTDLYRDWAPNVPWRQLIRQGRLVAFKGPAAPAGSGRSRPTAMKCWSLHHLTRAYNLLKFIKGDSEVRERVKAHRCVARKRGYQMDFLNAA